MDAPAYNYSAASNSSQESVSEDEYTSAFWNSLFCQCPIDGAKEPPTNHNSVGEWACQCLTPSSWDLTLFPTLHFASTMTTSMPVPFDAHWGDADPNNDINTLSPAALTSSASSSITDLGGHVQSEFALAYLHDVTQSFEESTQVAGTIAPSTSEPEAGRFEDGLPPKVIDAITTRFDINTYSILETHEVRNSKGSYWVVNIISRGGGDDDDPDSINAGTATISAMICNTPTGGSSATPEVFQSGPGPFLTV